MWQLCAPIVLLTHIMCVAAHFQFQSSILTHGRLSQSFSIWLIHGDVTQLNVNEYVSGNWFLGHRYRDIEALYIFVLSSKA